MIIIISPAKTIDFNLDFATKESTTPVFSKEANQLAKELKNMNIQDIAKLMHISEDLAALNFERYQTWQSPKTPKKQALAVFKGEVFNGIKAWEMSEADLLYAQDHLRILSGLYGILRPFDAVKAYRLEMGTKLQEGNLYKYWDTKITDKLNPMMKTNKTLINLASVEYSKSVQLKNIKGRVITPEFKEQSGDTYKTIAIYAKTARGLMTRYIIQNQIEDPEYLKSFNEEGYFFNENKSKGDKWVFTRH